MTPAGAWRLPNERELTLIQLAFNFFQDEDNLPFSPMVKPGDEDAVGDAYGWYNPLSLTCDLSDKRNHNFKHRLCAVFHCRTAYSYSRYYPGRHEYTPTGYILNVLEDRFGRGVAENSPGRNAYDALLFR